MQDMGGGKDVSRQSHLKPLTPMLDELGLLRVGGRLTRAELPYDTAHPVILPKKHHITRLFVADVHYRCPYAGRNHVLAQAQHRYWIIDGRQEERELRELVQSMDRERFMDDAANKGIKWNRNPPLGSHFGGVFESLI